MTRASCCNMGGRSRLILVGAVVSAHPAYAQRTDNNAVTAAEDAFGTSVGDQTIGIYNAGDVRGFSPIDAGNLRIEGLYFDLATGLNSRVVAGSTIRVGISAQGHAFPAPTGIVNYELSKPDAKVLTSVGLQYGPWRGGNAEVDVKIPIKGDTLGIAAGADVNHQGSSYGSLARSVSASAALRYAPREGIEIIPFWSASQTRDDEAQPIIFTAGDFLPKRAPRNVFRGQPWADYNGSQYNYGVVAKAEIAKFDVRFGAFRSIDRTATNAFDLLFDVERDGRVAERYVLRDRDNNTRATSGELRIARSVVEGRRQHTVIASVRYRDRVANYGNTDFPFLGPSRSDVPDVKPEPAFVPDRQARDSVRQTTFGIAYQGKWLKVGELIVGVQKTRYRKSVIDPYTVYPVTRDAPVLLSAAGALYITPQLATYASYTRGLEDGPVAPSNAANFNAIAPALRTTQKDAGLRWKVSKGVTFIGGVFDVRKPYYNLDSAGQFRQLGSVTHRGIEFSLAGQIAPNLRAVVGNSMIDEKVNNVVQPALSGRRPIGAFTRHTIVSLNYRLPIEPKLSFDAVFEGSSSRTANATDTLRIPTRAVMNIGMRYRFKVDDRPVLFRTQVSNVTNTFGWNVSPGGGFTANSSRRFLVSLSADI